MNPELDYDPSTDSLYIKVRAGESVDNRIIGDDVVIDLGTDGDPVGYDISTPVAIPKRPPKRWATFTNATPPKHPRRSAMPNAWAESVRPYWSDGSQLLT